MDARPLEQAELVHGGFSGPIGGGLRSPRRGDLLAQRRGLLEQVRIVELRGLRELAGVEIGRLLRRTQLEQVGQACEVLAQSLEHARRVQRGGRVKDRVQAHRAPPQRADLWLAVHACDSSRVGAQQLGREVAERADHARLDQLDLPVQVLLAVLDLDRLGVAVGRRPALQGVGDEHLRARHPDLAEQLLEQFPGGAHERQPLLVLARAGRLADEHQLGVGVARAEHDRLTRRCQLGAARTGLRLGVERLQCLASLGGRGLALHGHWRDGSSRWLRNDLGMPRAPDIAVTAPCAGLVVAIVPEPDAPVDAGAAVVVLEAMKMEHEVIAPSAGVVRNIEVAVGESVSEGQLLLVMAGEASGVTSADAVAEPDSVGPRADLQAVLDRHALGLDAARPEAVEKRRERDRRTARENLAELIDEGTFVEYGPLVFAAQERRRSREELITRTPADGLVAGIGDVEGRPCVVMSYDYTVLAGTQGMRNHAKKDRLFELAERRRLPVVLFAEGGGGRPGDVDIPIVAALDCRAFQLFARLSGLVPLVGIASGYCFAGNAALLGCCDVVIASEGTSIGMGGPAMIEGGGLGVYAPDEVGPIDVQEAGGVVDLRARDDAETVALARRYLSYFGPPRPPGPVPDQSLLRRLVPEQRKRAYAVRTVIDGLFDERSVLELRRGFGAGMVTALARLEGRALGVVANDPMHLGGAIDADAADKAARFTALCDAFALPLLFLCDTPGFMVGPEAERTGTVRHFARMFLAGANLSVPCGTIVLRKGYGLGAQAMAGGGFKAGQFTVGWPTSEFGAMGLEGAVRLGMRRELEAIADEQERERVFQATVAAAYERGQGISMASYGEIDDVIDPADSRRWIATLFGADPPVPGARSGKRRPYVDAW